MCMKENRYPELDLLLEQYPMKKVRQFARSCAWNDAIHLGKADEYGNPHYDWFNEYNRRAKMYLVYVEKHRNDNHEQK